MWNPPCNETKAGHARLHKRLGCLLQSLDLSSADDDPYEAMPATVDKMIDNMIVHVAPMDSYDL